MLKRLLYPAACLFVLGLFAINEDPAFRKVRKSRKY